MNLCIEATDGADLKAKLLDYLGPVAAMAALGDADILGELRQRMAPHGSVVKIVPFEGDALEDNVQLQSIA